MQLDSGRIESGGALVSLCRENLQEILDSFS